MLNVMTPKFLPVRVIFSRILLEVIYWTKEPAKSENTLHLYGSRQSQSYKADSGGARSWLVGSMRKGNGESARSEAIKGVYCCKVRKHGWQREIARSQDIQSLLSSHITGRVCCNTTLTSWYFPFSQSVKHFPQSLHLELHICRDKLGNVHRQYVSLIKSWGVKSYSVWS